jgi:Fur family ferric uptake transcriptional regulator
MGLLARAGFPVRSVAVTPQEPGWPAVFELICRPVTSPALAATKKKIRDLGLRVTAPRLAVLRALADADRPLSHAEVVTLLGDDIGWDRATVYRNLVALVGVNLVRVASHAGGITRYELARESDAECNHPHFVCDDCGIVSCLPGTEIVPPKKGQWSKAMKAAEVQFVGRCPSCASG